MNEMIEEGRAWDRANAVLSQDSAGSRIETDFKLCGRVYRNGKRIK